MPKSLPPQLQRWIAARKRFRLSHAHIQMARELGMNPKKLGSLANSHQELWKQGLPDFIESLYYKSFGKTRPDRVVSIEQRQREIAQAKQARRAKRLAEKKKLP